MNGNSYSLLTLFRNPTTLFCQCIHRYLTKKQEKYSHTVGILRNTKKHGLNQQYFLCKYVSKNTITRLGCAQYLPQLPLWEYLPTFYKISFKHHKIIIPARNNGP